MLLSKISSAFKSRREALIKAHPGSVFLFPAAEEAVRNPDVHYPFRQESNFFYLSGFEEPESFLVIHPKKTVLFVRKRDVEREMWDGPRYGTEGAKKVFGVDEAYLIDELDQRLPELVAGGEKIYYRVGQSGPNDRRVLAALEKHRISLGRSGKSLPPLCDPNEAVGEMRLFKSADDVVLLKKACDASAQAHLAAMQQTRPGMNETEIAALMDYTFRRLGCQREGYGSIVAGGQNAACLHYRLNNDPLNDGELLLIDAAGEYDYFTSDITRTFPIGKSFTAAQAKVYDLVLRAQKECIAMVRPGATLPAIHRHACEVITEGLLALGLLKGNLEDLLKSSAYKRFYPHNTSHWLGMDVHDTGLYFRDGQPRALEAGMVFTIEPGFYVQPEDKDVPGEYRKIGIRIEDNILVTPQGCEVLTHAAPKERDAIEALRHRAY